MKYYKSDDMDICMDKEHIFVVFDGEFCCTKDKKTIDEIMSLCPLPITREEFEESMEKIPCSIDHVMYSCCRRLLDIDDPEFMQREEENNGICNAVHKKYHVFKEVIASTNDVFTKAKCTECGREWIEKASTDANTFVKKLLE